MCCTGWSRRRSMFPISTSFWIECRSSRSATIFSVRKAAHGIPCGRLFPRGGITFPWRTSWESTPTMRSCTASSCCASVTMNWWSSCGKENGTWKLPQQQESIGKLQASAAQSNRNTNTPERCIPSSFRQVYAILCARAMRFPTVSASQTAIGSASSSRRHISCSCARPQRSTSRTTPLRWSQTARYGRNGPTLTDRTMTSRTRSSS